MIHQSNRSNSANCSVVILTYNGRRHLEVSVPSALSAAARVAGGCPVVVVDNQSDDDSVAWLKEKYPQVEAVIADRNDCLFSLNRIVALRAEEIIVILNNDMRFDEAFITAMLPHFEDSEVFAVTAKVYDWEGMQNTTGQVIGQLRNFWFYKKLNTNIKASCFTLYAGGGCAAFRRSMFLELNGFDPLYRPAYWEDTDLSYRAWKRGWKVIYEPRSVIYHKVGVTLNEIHGKARVSCLIQRNEILFTVKNCGDIKFLLMYLLLLPFRAFKSFFTGNHPLTHGFFSSLPKFPLVLLRRLRETGKPFVSDQQFLEMIEKNIEFDPKPLRSTEGIVQCKND